MYLNYKKWKSDFRSQYTLNLKKSLVATLFIFNLLIFLSPGVDVVIEEKRPPEIIIEVENIPVTKQVHRNPPPPKPTIPVPTDEESIPEDLTIEETTLKYTNIFDDTPDGVPGITGVSSSPPKPISWVFPEYPEGEKKKGVQGVVKVGMHIDEKGKVVEVIVLENTTNSEKCAQAAIEAAYGSRFFPAREGNKPVSYWLSQPYRFDIKD